ncbi:MAG: hypothetical protein COV75_05840 [Candidatus Omnitrophica bacterium CG11_big_fil_rev_8_21_14_0_20_63_9]|nr:MAG: hypothetical protein COV75_05840 [Candidatus Omnitrophica bacterium CG11_big_fil_rev_8_21_14_0_20_63_9]
MDQVTGYATRNKNINHIQCTKRPEHPDAVVSGAVSVEEMSHRTVAEHLAEAKARHGSTPKLLYEDGRPIGYAYGTDVGVSRTDRIRYFAPLFGQGSVLCPSGSFMTGVFKRASGTTDKNVTIIRCERLDGEHPDEPNQAAVFLTDGVRMPTDTALPDANDPAWGACPVGSGAIGLLLVDHARGPAYGEWTNADTLTFVSGFLTGNPVTIIGNVVILVVRSVLESEDNFNVTERFLVCKTLPHLPPRVSFLKPSPSSWVVTDKPTINITAFATDDEGFESIKYPFQWASNRTRSNGSIIQGTTQCYLGACVAKNIQLMPGRNEITFEVEDRDGAVGTAVFVVERRVPAPPRVTILAPTEQPTYTTAEATLTLSASVESTGTLQSVTWKNAQNGSTGVVAKTTYGWVALKVPLVMGSNVITYTATDSNGTSGSDSITITRTSNNYTCGGGTLCNWQPVTGTPGQIVCGTTLRNYQCTAEGWKDLGTSCACTLPLPPLKTPSNLKAAGSCSGTSSRIRVSWDSVPTATQYELHRKPNDSITPYAEIANTSNASFIDTTVARGKSYQYKVRARRASDGAVSRFQTDFSEGAAPLCK